MAIITQENLQRANKIKLLKETANFEQNKVIDYFSCMPEPEPLSKGSIKLLMGFLLGFIVALVLGVASKSPLLGLLGFVVGFAVGYKTSGKGSPKKSKEAEFDEIVSKQRQQLNTYQAALNKIGLDEDQLKEIAPVSFEGFQDDVWKVGGNEVVGFNKVGKDQKFRSGKYAITHMFFSATQVYMYQYSFNFYNNEKKERTEEYFYQDITNFSTLSESINTYMFMGSGSGCTGAKANANATKMTTTNIQRFALIVPGDRFSCDTQMDIEQSVQGMKAKLREKKNV